jgi:hypothetical protein
VPAPTPRWSSMCTRGQEGQCREHPARHAGPAPRVPDARWQDEPGSPARDVQRGVLGGWRGLRGQDRRGNDRHPHGPLATADEVWKALNDDRPIPESALRAARIPRPAPTVS